MENIFLDETAMKTTVIFSVEAKKNIFSNGCFIRPVNEAAYYFCLLVKRDKLSIKDLYVIEKLGILMGFKVKLIRKKTKRVAIEKPIDDE